MYSNIFSDLTGSRLCPHSLPLSGYATGLVSHFLDNVFHSIDGFVFSPIGEQKFRDSHVYFQKSIVWTTPQKQRGGVIAKSLLSPVGPGERHGEKAGRSSISYDDVVSVNTDGGQAIKLERARRATSSQHLQSLSGADVWGSLSLNL